MNTKEDIKQVVKDTYNKIANQSKAFNQASCCGAGGCSTELYNIMSEDYATLQGYQSIADLGLGCGLPTEFAQIKKGNTVVDLGSGAGNDCFVARAITTETGKVIGIDFSETMIEKARVNAETLGFNNVEFRLGDIERIPMTANSADVVISNCVLNLVPNKVKVFQEIMRILKPGGHLSISDVVLVGDLPSNLKNAAEMYAGCVSGAIQKTDYIELINQTGFNNIVIQKEKEIQLPDDILINHLSKAEIQEYRKSKVGVFSITIYAEKKECTGPNCCN